LHALRKFSVEKAIALQKKLSKRVKKTSFLPSRLKRIGGLDVAYFDDRAIGSCAIVDCETLKTLETITVLTKVTTPYMPGFLAFREAPIMVKTAKRLNLKPDVYLVDGQGIAHPRRFGLASHVGVLLDSPTIGVAKSRLYGEIEGGVLYGEERDVLGALFATKRSGKTLYISIGHKISLEDALRIVSRCTINSGPEPLRVAHEIAVKRRLEVRS
jgi:deoxyribonuclease V